MLISTKGRYALRVMIDLAEHQTDGYIPLKEVAQRQDISEKYLETIIRLLVKANILSGLRGKGGGYKLTKSPDHCWRYFTTYGRLPGAGFLSRTRRSGLCQSSGMPHFTYVAGSR